MPFVNLSQLFSQSSAMIGYDKFCILQFPCGDSAICPVPTGGHRYCSNGASCRCVRMRELSTRMDPWEPIAVEIAIGKERHPSG